MFREPGTPSRRPAAAKRKAGVLSSPSRSSVEKSIKLEQNQADGVQISADESATLDVVAAAGSENNKSAGVLANGDTPPASLVEGNNNNSVKHDSDDTDDEDFAKSKMTGRYLSVSLFGLFPTSILSSLRT